MFDIGFLKLPLIRKRFTWFQINGFTVSRLDHILIFERWWDNWGVSCHLVFPTISHTTTMWFLSIFHTIRGRNLLDLVTFVWIFLVFQRHSIRFCLLSRLLVGWCLS